MTPKRTARTASTTSQRRSASNREQNNHFFCFVLSCFCDGICTCLVRTAVSYFLWRKRTFARFGDPLPVLSVFRAGRQVFASIMVGPLTHQRVEGSIASFVFKFYYCIDPARFEWVGVVWLRAPPRTEGGGLVARGKDEKRVSLT